MFKQIFRLTFVTFIWKRYKRVIVSTALLLLFFWLVNFAHAEYLAFAQYNDQGQNIGLSFIAKWMSLVIGAIIYLIYSFWVPVKIDGETINDKKTKKQQVDLSIDPNAPDPFEAIRQKDKLRTRAEMAIEKNLNDSKSGSTKK